MGYLISPDGTKWVPTISDDGTITYTPYTGVITDLPEGVGSVSTFNLRAQDIIRKAARKAKLTKGDMQILPPGMEKEALDELNMMVKEWQTRHTYLWTVDQDVVMTMTKAVSTVNFGSVDEAEATIDLQDVRIKDSSGNERSLTQRTKEEWDTLPNKTTQGLPTQYCIVKGLANPEIRLYPVPDATTASDYTIVANRVRKLQDFTSGKDTPDFPSKWLSALVYGLAYRLSFDSDNVTLNQQAILKAEAMDLFYNARSDDSETGDVFIQPDIC